MKKVNWILLFVFILPVLPITLETEAATVTVNAAGGADYTELTRALGNFRRGDNWGDGNADTVLVQNGIYLMGSAFLPGDLDNVTLDSVVGGGDGTFTVRADTGASPILALDPAHTDRSFIYCRREGNVTLEGLTFVGRAGSPTFDGGQTHQAFIQGDSEDADGVQVIITIRDCVFTKNIGTTPGVDDAPELDFTGDIPDNSTNGAYQGIFWSGDSRARGNLDVTIEDSVIAYSNYGNGAVFVQREIDDMDLGADPDESNDLRNFTVRNTLFASNQRAWRQVDGVAVKESATFEDCAFLNHPSEVVRFTDRITGMQVTFNHCLVDAGNVIDVGDGMINGDTFFRVDDCAHVDLTVDEFTGRQGNNDLFRFGRGDCVPANGLETIVLRNIVDVNGNDSVFRYNPDEDDLGPGFEGQPASLTASGIASDNTVRTTQHDNIETILNNATVITDVPESDLLDVAFTNATFANIRSWDSVSNGFLDIAAASASKYIGMGDAGSDLRGGAEIEGQAGPTPTPLPIPSSDVGNWAIYQ